MFGGGKLRVAEVVCVERGALWLGSCVYRASGVAILMYTHSRERLRDGGVLDWELAVMPT